MTAVKYSETFYSAQGEGHYTGIPSLWMRFFLCNLQCDGFGQADPTDPDSYELPYQTIDIEDVTDVTQLPVFSKGCDSSYTWSKRFRHLIVDRTPEQAVDELTAILPHGKFVHPVTDQPVHMVFTGGEPMLKNTQLVMIKVLEEFEARDNLPMYITIETNGTKPLTPELRDYIDGYLAKGGEWFWSVSPKLWNTAGEKPEKAIKPDVVRDYTLFGSAGQLKYVVNGGDASWDEVSDNTAKYRRAGCDFPVWIMGVGGTVEGLKMTEAMIADQTIERGYNYTSRMQCHIYGNVVGK
jgi:7-carboxy-7-deazaguanine synthase